MVTREGRAKVIDFSATKEYHSGKDHSVLLKHGYAPIEQYDSHGKQGPWTDVYSLCGKIFYLLTGRKPQRAYERVSEDKMVSLRQMGVNVSEEKSQAVKKGLSVQIEDRYQRMADLYYDLYGEVLSGEKEKQS